MVEIKSKTGVVSKPPYELYMVFVDMRNLVRFLPEDKKEGVTADYDSLQATVQGFNIGVRVTDRTPYSKLEFEDDGAPFKFKMKLFFEPSTDPYKTDFSITLEADLNFMMKTILSSKIKDALDKIVDSLVAMSEGRMPEGMENPMK